MEPSKASEVQDSLKWGKLEEMGRERKIQGEHTRTHRPKKTTNQPTNPHEESKREVEPTETWEREIVRRSEDGS